MQYAEEIDEPRADAQVENLERNVSIPTELLIGLNSLECYRTLLLRSISQAEWLASDSVREFFRLGRRDITSRTCLWNGALVTTSGRIVSATVVKSRDAGLSRVTEQAGSRLLTGNRIN